MKSLQSQKVILIIGPTASGKTRLSIHLAKLLQSEIVSADSRQIYRYMNIGTAKPTLHEIEDIPHHGFDLCDPDEYYSAGIYSQYARNIIDNIFKRKKQPIVVGGSGLYIRSLVDGVFEGNYRDEAIRSRLKTAIEKKGLDLFYHQLCELDPVAAKVIHPNDEKRILRALEVIEISSSPITLLQKEKTVPANFDPLFFGLAWPRELLYDRINQRVDEMIQNGLVDEIKFLLEKGYSLANNALDSVGYKELINYLDGKTSLDEAVELIKRNTRRFAKRQMTWFRKDERIHWLIPDNSTDWEYLVKRICEQHQLI